jgi:hypothetical protein
MCVFTLSRVHDVNPKPYNGYVDTPLLGKATTAKRRVCGEDKPTGGTL